MSKETKTNAQKVSTAGGFVAGAVAACGAVTFTNPIELIKTRMQLQGELVKTSAAAKIYTNPAQAFVLIFKKEGIRGLQQGLLCGYVYQVCLNGCRIGLYEPTRHFLTKYLAPLTYVEGSVAPQSLPINVAAGTVSGIAGAVLGSPFFLIKTRMQSYSKAAADAVGQQTYYRGIGDGLSQIWRTQGFRGLYKGVDAAIFRTGCGSSVQLPVYNLTKEYILNHNLISPANQLGLHFAAASLAGLAVALAMNPGDVILTRVYNLSTNKYKGPLDCLRKTLQTEGPFALYKGFWAQLFRIGPHSILTLMFMEHTMSAMSKIEDRFSLAA